MARSSFMKLKKTISLLLMVTMLIPMCLINTGTVSSAHVEVSSDGGWYTWSTMQSATSGVPLESVYGDPVSSYFSNGQYTAKMNYALNKSHSTTGDVSGNISSSLARFDVIPCDVSVSFRINTTNGGTGICTDSLGRGKFSVGIIPAANLVDIVAMSNNDWANIASCGLANMPYGIYVSFASLASRRDGYCYCKVSQDGKTMTKSDLDGWVYFDNAFDATGNTEYTIRLVRTGGSAADIARGVYSVYIDTPTESIELATGLYLRNDAKLRYYLSSASPAYDPSFPTESSYTVTKVGVGGVSAVPQDFEGRDDHLWDDGDVTVEPTCAAAGVKTYTCTVDGCGVTKTEKIDSTGHHLYGEYTVAIEPTCTKKGVRQAVCLVCGEDKKINIASLGHAFGEFTETSAPTCTAPGVLASVCANCGLTETKYSAPVGHTFGEYTVTVPATDTKQGEMVRVCTVCGDKEYAPIAVESAPDILVASYKVNVRNSAGLNYVRVAPGVYNTAKEIKNAPGLVTYDLSAIKTGTENGVFSFNVSALGAYSIWLRYSDGNEYVQTVYAEKTYPFVTASGVFATVHDLGDVYDFMIAKGHYTTYRQVSDNKIVRKTAANIGTAHDFTYGAALPGTGEYTLWVRYNDSAREATCIHFSCTVTTPEFISNGLNLTVKNTEDARVIRLAAGKWSSPAEIKRAAGCRNFTSKQITPNGEYSIKIADNAIGIYTASIEYNNGYSEVYSFNVAKNTPTVEVGNEYVKLGDLENLYILRYAPGVYTTSNEIKAAPGSKTIRPEDVVGYEVELILDGTYSFLVQYTDGSVNVFTETMLEKAAGVTVSRAFSDDMVVQRDKPLSVWGWAPKTEAGKAVEVSFRGETVLTNVDKNGRWKATFAKTFPKSADPAQIKVKGKDASYTFDGVLTGDVYYILGQSNVEWSVRVNAEDRLKAGLTDFSYLEFDPSRNFRLFRNSREFYRDLTGEDKQGTAKLFEDVVSPLAVWRKPSADDEQVELFSAIGYLTAYNLSKSTDVPIGMIEIDATGSPLSTFSPNELCEKWGSDIYWEEGGGVFVPHFHGILFAASMSRYAYNQQLYPLTNFACAGLIWYQGESDELNTIYNFGKNVYTFSSMFRELMYYYREHFANSDFPIFVVEFPACYKVGINPFIDFGRVRAELGSVIKDIPNCYYIPSSDVWGPANSTWEGNIHPYCKPEHAYKIHNMILSVNYPEYSTAPAVDAVAGPQMTNISYPDANTAVITFTHVGLGLRFVDYEKDQILHGFEALINPNTYKEGWMIINDHSASITAYNQITLRCDRPIYGIRYHGYSDYSFPYKINVCNSFGAPMTAFVDYKN